MYLALAFVLIYSVSFVSSGNFPSKRRTYGSPAARKQLPYHAGILLKDSQYIKSGALVTNKHIITVADFNESEEDIRVFLGASVYTEENEEGRLVFDLTFQDSVKIHEGYRHSKNLYNIAFITLPYELNFTDYISAIELPIWEDRERTFAGEQITVSGWSIKSGKGRPSRSLHFASGRIAPDNKCIGRRDFQVTRNHICVETTLGRIPCDIDAGAPIVYEESGLKMIIGLGASDGHCSHILPHVATKFVAHLQWFQSHRPILIAF